MAYYIEVGSIIPSIQQITRVLVTAHMLNENLNLPPPPKEIRPYFGMIWVFLYPEIPILRFATV